MDTLNTQIHDRPLSWFGTGTSIKSGEVKLVLWAQTFLFTEVMQKCVPDASKMSSPGEQWFYKERNNLENYT
jgi:hypothetical protein